MKLVLDASAALAAALQHTTAGPVLKALEEASVVIAPDSSAGEIAHAVRRYAAARQLEPHAAARLCELALGLIDRFIPTASLAQEALHESIVLGIPIADLFYAVLARREAAPVLTIDRKLEKALAELRIGLVLRQKNRRG